MAWVCVAVLSIATVKHTSSSSAAGLRNRRIELGLGGFSMNPQMHGRHHRWTDISTGLKIWLCDERGHLKFWDRWSISERRKKRLGTRQILQRCPTSCDIMTRKGNAVVMAVQIVLLWFCWQELTKEHQLRRSYRHVARRECISLRFNRDCLKSNSNVFRTLPWSLFIGKDGQILSSICKSRCLTVLMNKQVYFCLLASGSTLTCWMKRWRQSRLQIS